MVVVAAGLDNRIPDKLTLPIGLLLCNIVGIERVLS